MKGIRRRINKDKKRDKRKESDKDRGKIPKNLQLLQTPLREAVENFAN